MTRVAGARRRHVAPDRVEHLPQRCPLLSAHSGLGQEGGAVGLRLAGPKAAKIVVDEHRAKHIRVTAGEREGKVGTRTVRYSVKPRISTYPALSTRYGLRCLKHLKRRGVETCAEKNT